MTIPVFNAELFKVNLEILTKLNPLAAYRLELIWNSQELSLCETEKGELNLVKKRYGISDYYHAQRGALEEAKEITDSETIEKTDTFYIFGIGLGYFYDALFPWLQKKPTHHLVFLEDDLEVIYYFLQTERATALLKNSQVTFFYFHEYAQDYDKFYKLLISFSNRQIKFLALPYYAIKRKSLALQLCFAILHDASLMSSIHNEYLSGQKGFLTNFYRNFLLIHQSYTASGLFGQFKNIPAIICGAGPSLQKNIHLLKSLTNHALIFAGGSSLNALNHVGLVPHFGLGVDPNSEQYHRLLTNHTFHVPYLYRPRLSHEAFQLMQGPKIYIPGSVNKLAAWFDKKLGLSEEFIDEGHNVVNLCTEIAYRMGCNPIIYLGMDLAFTEIQPYALGINTHPLWIADSRPYLVENKEVVNRLDIYGQPIKTKWDWIAESNWISHFAKQHPDVALLNATEGGLGFDPIPNYSLEEVVKQHFKQTYDLSNWVHTDIQNNKIAFPQSSIFNVASEMKMSLGRCLKILKQMIEEKIQLLEKTSINDVHQLAFYTTNTILQESDLKGEAGYQHFLELFENAYTYVQDAHEMAYHQNPPLFIDILNRYRFLESIVSQNIDLMMQAVQRFIAFPPPISHVQETRSIVRLPDELYSFSEGHLQIKDPELDIYIDDKFTFNPQKDRLTQYYPNEQLKYETFYFENQLHGLSRFYHPQGALLAESWFFKGHQEGKSYQYYPSKTLYSIRRFRHNLLHGKQEYFFENGTPHIIMHYYEGFLQGDVFIYTMTGKVQRELHYHKGHRHGLEKMWDTNGNLLIECHYQEGVPIGRAQQWSSQGWLSKQVDIHHFPNDFDLSLWNAKGEKIQSFEHGIEDFSSVYEETQKKANELEENLKILMQQITPLITGNTDQSQEAIDLNNNLSSIKESLEEMQKLKNSLDETMHENLQKAKEAKRQQQFLGREE